jgi:hypothetical protein
MSLLGTAGFGQLIQETVVLARGCADAATALGCALTLGGRLPEELALRALSSDEQVLYTAAGRDALLRFGQDAWTRDCAVLTETGRLRMIRAHSALPDQAELVGELIWPAGRPAGLTDRLNAALGYDVALMKATQNWLIELPAKTVVQLVDHLETILSHVGPIRVYVGADCYTNLGRQANLLGKSVGTGSSRCALAAVRTVPASEWPIELACFVAGLTILLRSGTPSRAEEFSGTQLLPDRLVRFLEARLAAYGRPVSETTEPTNIDMLMWLADECAAARAAAMARGVRPYRIVHGLTVHKRECLMTGPLRLRSVPAQVLITLAEMLDTKIPGDFDAVTASFERVIPHLRASSSRGFTSRLEELLHEIISCATTSLQSDAGMSRGPRSVGSLSRLIKSGSLEPRDWTTSNYFCCVTPSQTFVRRFEGVPCELPKTLRAIAARMRYNSWHFMPDSAGIAQQCPDRDWFFAPSMPDTTRWTDQHHQGHVANGIRHAIRVPFGVHLAGAHRPGVYDFRLVRTAGSAYDAVDFKAAISVGEVLRRLYQVLASHVETTGDEWVVSDFDNRWYQARYAPEVDAVSLRTTRPGLGYRIISRNSLVPCYWDPGGADPPKRTPSTP